jgi:hypothetical protein
VSNNGSGDRLHGHPIDMLGNEIKKGSLMMVTFPSASVICRVKSKDGEP